MEVKSGVYCILNKNNNKRYIGSSVNTRSRLLQHRSQLKRNVHYNSALQKDFNINHFEFYVLEYCDKNSLLNKEQYWIDFYGGINSKNLYNQWNVDWSDYNKSFSKNVSIATIKAQKDPIIRNKMSVSHIGKKHSLETIEKISKGNKGKNHPKGINTWFKGRKRVNNGINNKFVLPEELDKYLNQGWKLGGIQK